jgi:hypothetical protein
VCDCRVSLGLILTIIVGTLKELTCKSRLRLYDEIDAGVFAFTPQGDGERVTLEGGP